MFQVFLTIQILITLALVVSILIQRSDSDGLAGLGGGGGGGNSFMTGRAAANAMTRITAVLATLFMINSLWLAIITTSSSKELSISDRIEAEDASVKVPVAGEEDATTEAPTETMDAAPAEEMPKGVPTAE